MTAALHVCRHCGGLILDEGDGVFLGYESGMSGPGWDVWAHREHAALVGPDPVAVRVLARLATHRAEGGPDAGAAR